MSSNPLTDDEMVFVDLILSSKNLLSAVPELTENHFPGGDRTPNRGDIQFNSCEGTHPVYSAVLHEAGHALGITGGTDGTDDEQNGHPYHRIAEAVMSYGTKHDCFPHPLDIGVIYALYQTQ